MNKVFNKASAAAMLVILGILLAISPAGSVTLNAVDSETLNRAMLSGSYYVSADEVAQLIIDGAPDMLIVDLRSVSEFSKGNVKNSMNITMDKVFDAENIELFDSGMDIIFYSADDVQASQVWMLLKQKGIETSVMKGGMNFWVSSILSPVAPGESASDNEIALYNMRKGAAAYFTGGVVLSSSSTPRAVTGMKRPAKKKKKGGSCF